MIHNFQDISWKGMKMQTWIACIDVDPAENWLPKKTQGYLEKTPMKRRKRRRFMNCDSIASIYTVILPAGSPWGGGQDLQSEASWRKQEAIKQRPRRALELRDPWENERNHERLKTYHVTLASFQAVTRSWFQSHLPETFHTDWSRISYSRAALACGQSVHKTKHTLEK